MMDQTLFSLDYHGVKVCGPYHDSSLKEMDKEHAAFFKKNIYVDDKYLPENMKIALNKADKKLPIVFFDNEELQATKFEYLADISFFIEQHVVPENRWYSKPLV